MNGMDRADAGARLNVLVGGRALGISWPMRPPDMGGSSVMPASLDGRPYGGS
jgi:hypothetical protein